MKAPQGKQPQISDHSYNMQFLNLPKDTKRTELHLGENKKTSDLEESVIMK